MGLITAAVASAATGIGDQFKEFITCPDTDKNVLIQRGEVHHGKGNVIHSGVITNGSKIVVPQGMAMMIIDNGVVKEFSAEPGEYIYDSSSEPSVFTGGFLKGVKDTIKTIGNRITYGGQAARDQRVYYVNLLKITGNPFGSPQPKKITDDRYGMLEVTFFGTYAFQVVDPVRLIHGVIGANAKDTVTYDEVVGDQLSGKFVERLSQAISTVMRKNHVSFGDILLHNSEITDEMNVALDDSWREQYGLEITDVSLNDLNLTDESMARVTKLDDATLYSNVDLRNGMLASQTADAMNKAASNTNGAMAGFMGMGFAGQTGANAMQSSSTNGTPFNPTPFASVSTDNSSQQSEDTVKKYCGNCGTEVTTKFCPNCGTQVD
ncbi:MAG: SPFH domain-containing protein [Bacilli bacterium]|nr:SPFH domain-containing protein [Bacilli bacterium]